MGTSTSADVTVDDVSLEIVARAYDDPDVIRLVAEVQAEYVLLYGGPDAAAVDVLEFAPPNGLLLVGLLDGEPVMTGGWRRLDTTTDVVAEIKRMYVRAPARGHGLSRVMLAELERSAGRAGIRRLVLNTGSLQQAAVALYRTSGYVKTAGFGLYAKEPGALFFAKAIEATATDEEPISPG